MRELFRVYRLYLGSVPRREYFKVLLDSEHVSVVYQVDFGVRGEHVEEIYEWVLGESHVLFILLFVDLFVVLFVVLFVLILSLDESEFHLSIVLLVGVHLSETGLNGG